MKKKVWIPLVVIVLIAAWLGGSWYAGKRIQAEIEPPIALINQKLALSPSPVKEQIQQISYERGLFSSHVRYGITANLIPGQQMAELDVTIWHGPFPFGALQHGHLLPMQFWAHGEMLATYGPAKMALGAIMNGKPPLVVDGGCNYGSSHCTIMGSVPPIDADLGAISQNAKLSFGGAQMRFDIDHHSDTDYKGDGNVQLLPLSISGQNFGNGQITFTSDAQSVNEQITWKTDPGESKITLALAWTQPVPLWDGPESIEAMAKLTKTASLNLSLSKPMIVDLAARITSLTQGVDLADAQRVANEQIDTLSNNPDTAKFLRAQGDLLVSDWQYADGKLTINGQENPQLLEQLKQSYLTQLGQAQAETDGQASALGAESRAASAAAPSASAPALAASGR